MVHVFLFLNWSSSGRSLRSGFGLLSNTIMCEKLVILIYNPFVLLKYLCVMSAWLFRTRGSHWNCEPAVGVVLALLVPGLHAVVWIVKCTPLSC